MWNPYFKYRQIRNYSGYSQMHENGTRTLVPAASAGVTLIQRIHSDFLILIRENPPDPQHRALQGKSAFYSNVG
ncbi:MAG: hypothetical protein KJ638_15525 [Chloroflexi bacterium]|nr:hypothetical protein [Chloroflexota bacterium]